MVKALPKMMNAATSEKLRSGFEDHLKQTQEHVARLEKVFKALGEAPAGKKCKGMEGLIAEGGEMIASKAVSEELDAGLIAAAQRVEHYEIAGYGCVAAYAKLLGEDEALMLLRKTLEEEKNTDEKLTELASQINLEAADSVEETKGGKEAKKPKARAARG
jgi:ferritin-like metal-binding protein YciE